MSRFRPRIVIAIGLVITALYSGTFTVSRLRCPRTVHDVRGQTVRIVESHGNSFPLKIEFLWLPAWWVLQHGCEYRPVGFAPGRDGDTVYWARNPPAEWQPQ